MSLEYAILGFLNYGPLSGYDLKKIFDTSVAHFWSADQSQIYRILSRLDERGWTQTQVISQADRPDRKEYHITSLGQEHLRRWLEKPLPSHPHRNASLIQVFFAGQLDDQEILDLFEHQAQQIRAILEAYDQIPDQSREYVEQVDSPRESFFWMLTLECGITLMQAQLAWIESVIARIRNREYPTG